MVGIVNAVVAVAVSVVAKAPDVVRFPPRVMVFPELLTPVPPLAPVNGEDNVSEAKVGVLVAAMSCGVVRVMAVPLTGEPLVAFTSTWLAVP